MAQPKEGEGDLLTHQEGRSDLLACSSRLVCCTVFRNKIKKKGKTALLTICTLLGDSPGICHTRISLSAPQKMPDQILMNFVFRTVLPGKLPGSPGPANLSSRLPVSPGLADLGGEFRENRFQNFSFPCWAGGGLLRCTWCDFNWEHGPERKKSVEAAPSSPGHCLYTVDEVKRCVAGVQGVSYGEPVDLLTQGWR